MTERENGMVRNVADIYQSGQYSIEAQKVKRAQGALNILSNSGKQGKRDMVHISYSERTYSKESVVALFDTALNLSASDFSFYFDHYNNMPALLDAINFGEGFVMGSCNPEMRELGVLSFKIGGVRQYIPNYAIPKINAEALPNISAKNNKLILNNKGYYCYTAKNGKNYTWTVNNGHVGWANSERMSEVIGENKSGYNYRWEMHQASNLISRLAKGSGTYGFSNEEQKEILAGFGITEGHFTIDAGAGTRHYMLLENGVIVDIDKRIDFMNRTDWKKQGYQTGDVINVYGKECVVDEAGHINVTADDEFSDTDVDYFHVDTTSQISRRPVIINMEMPADADYDLTVYDENGNQVGMAVENEDGTKTLTIPCDWSNSRRFVIKVSQNGSGECVEGNYKLTFSQGEMPQEVREALKRMQTGTAKLQEGNPEERAALGDALKAKNDARNAAETEGLHQAQYNALPEELKYKGDSSVEELLKKELRGESVTEAERAYIAIYGNQNDIYHVECQKRKQELEQEFAAYLESVDLSGKEFSIHLETGGKAVVSGLDEAQKEQVEDYIEVHWEQFKNIYLTTSNECAEMTDQEYRIAGYVEECNRFLSNASGGKVSVDDLSMERKVTGWYINSENIVGLPSVIASSLNSADSTDKYYDYKQMLHSILNYKQEYEEIPQYHMDFKWSEKELQC